MSELPALQYLLTTYTDILGRVSLKPSNKDKESTGDFDSNNALLYTGELSLLLKKAGLYTFNYQVQHNLAYSSCTVRFGNEAVLTRHPEPYRFNPNMRPLSFDELRGLFMAATVNPQLKPIALALIRYGENNNWVFTDQPNEEYKGKSLLSLLKTPKETVSQWKAYRARAKGIGLDNGGMRKAAQEFKYLNPMFFWSQPSNRMFYKMCANRDTTLLERSWFLLAEILGAFEKDDGQNSSRLMGGFMHLALNNVEHKSLLVKAARLVYHTSCRYHFGRDYMYDMCSKYYKEEHHPITVLSFGVEVL